MAVFEAKNLHNGSEMVASIQDTRRSYFRSVAWASAIDGDLNNGVLATLGGIPTTAQVGTSIVPLDSISATYISNSTAMLAAVYRNNVGQVVCGTNRVSLSTGHEPVTWYHTPASFDGTTGEPSGAVRRDAFGTPIAWRWMAPVWNLTFGTELSYNPANAIKGFLTAPLNSDAVTWDGFALAANQVRFNGALIQYRGSSYYVTYSFSLRYRWYEEFWDFSNTTIFQHAMYKTATFASAFPIGASGTGC